MHLSLQQSKGGEYKVALPQLFTAFVSKALKRSGLTQDKFAMELGIQRAAVNNWLNGRNYPADEHIRKMAEMTGDDPDEMIAIRESLNIHERLRRKGYKINRIGYYLLN
jgi:transcriptional regulator with XRE-family HTH domain